MFFFTIFGGGLLGSSVSRSAESQDHFICSCMATGPGVEKGEKADKICSYDCKCMTYGSTAPPVKNIPVNVNQVISTAISHERWDAGSHICHGQYAWRPSMDDPNWKIKVKFSSFQITSEGTLTHLESVETSIGVSESLKRSSTAPEILEVIKKALQTSKKEMKGS